VESKLGPLGTSAIYSPIVPAPGDCEDGEFDGMNGRGNRSTRRKPAPAPLCPPQIPLDQTGFISSWVIHSLLSTLTHRQYSAITHLHTFQFTVAHALGFPVYTSCLLAINLNTRIITVSLNHTPNITYKSSLIFTRTHQEL
jgi:hypothetical protein